MVYSHEKWRSEKRSKTYVISVDVVYRWGHNGPTPNELPKRIRAMFTVTSFTHPTMLAKIREAIRFAVMGEGEKMNGHSHRCYVENSKGHNVMRVDYREGKIVILAGCTKAFGSKDVTALVKAAFKAAKDMLINPNMAVCLDNEIACPVRMVPVQ